METGFGLTLSETPKTGFLATRPKSCKEKDADKIRSGWVAQHVSCAVELGFSLLPESDRGVKRR